MGATAVIILGMHRSGTSCLTGSLQQAGLYLGRVNTTAPHNSKGNRENFGITALNDAVLSAAGGAWDKPPAVPISWSAENKAARDALIATYPDSKAWAFKDPRTLFTLEGWLEALPDARLVGSFRHPLAVAKSLKARAKAQSLEGQAAAQSSGAQSGFSIEQGIDLWLTYNRRLLQVCQQHDVPLVNFDWTPQQYAGALTALSKMLDLTPPQGGFAFFENELRRQAVDPELEMPSDVGDLYSNLRDIADRLLPSEDRRS